MEHRMDGRVLGKKQPIGDVADLVDDPVWSEELEAELLMSVWSQRGLDIWLQSKVDEVADVELALGPPFVSLLLHALLGAKQVLPDGRPHGCTLSHHGSNIGHRGNRFVSKTKMSRRMP